MITVVPEGGLCNRMRVVASSWLLARAAGQRMRVLWYRTPDFNARFDALFAADGLPFEIVELEALRRHDRLLWRLREPVRRLLGQTVIGPKQTAPGAFDTQALALQLRRPRVYIRTNTRLIFEPGMYALFRPVAALAERIAGLSPRLAQSVGVHVRRTDNTTASAVSTLERFIALMQAERAADAKRPFFVATDSPAVMASLREIFGDGIWEHPKRAYARNDPLALADAVVDLYALGQCRKLIGSYWSSFTDTAAELRGIECLIAKGATA